MRKTALIFIFALLLFSLSGCVVFQKVMNVSGNWIVELEENVVLSQLRSLELESQFSRDTWFYSSLKLNQNGNQLSGKFYFLYMEIDVSGTIGEDDTVELEGDMPVVSAERGEKIPSEINVVLEGKATGSKTLFNKTATKIEGEMYFDDDPTDSFDFEATK